MTSATEVFSVVIFFISFREAMEASLIIGTLMGMLESLARDILPDRPASATTTTSSDPVENLPTIAVLADVETDQERVSERRVLVKQLRKTILLGAASGLSVSFIIGAVFLAVFYTQANDLYAKADDAWEGAFNLLAMLLITPMALALLRADRSRGKWRLKLANAFAGKLDEKSDKQEPAANVGQSTGVDSSSHPEQPGTPSSTDGKATTKKSDGEDVPSATDGSPLAELAHSSNSHTGVLESTTPVSKPTTLYQRISSTMKHPFRKHNRGRTTIFTIPFITTLREGLEGVVFIGGVSLGLPATSIPLAAIVGIALGLLLGFVVFKAGGFSKIRYFLLVSTCLLLLIASGMASRSVFGLQFFRYVRKVGSAAAESGSGPGSYDATNYVWHLDCCNPNENSGGTGWGILNSLVGWNNTGTIGSILAYVFYWFVVISYLLYSLWKEGRLALAYRWKGQRIALWESKRCSAKRQQAISL